MNVEPPKSHSRRFRFSLKSLLLLVTVAAVCSWTFFIGWPWWQACLEQARYEGVFKQLKVGSTPYDPLRMLSITRGVDITYGSDSDGNSIGVSRLSATNATYLIYYHFPRGYPGGMLQCPCTRVEVFRLPPGELDGEFDPLKFFSGDRKDHPGVKWELIHADPPMEMP